MQSLKALHLLWIVLFAPLILFSPAAEAVKRENFKTCDQSGFCKRNRAIADVAALSNPSGTSAYRLNLSSVEHSDGQIRGTILKTVADSETVRLPFNVTFYESGVARVTVDEEKRRTGQIELRHGSKARKERYNEADAWALVGEPKVDKSIKVSEQPQDGVTTISYGDSSRNAMRIRHDPFGIEFARDGDTQVVFNRRGLLNIEQWRPKTEVDGPDGSSSEDESTWWEESFGGNTDSKPKGPESVALDISFPGYQHVFGIPEHTGPLSLRETRGGSQDSYTEPYRMYNSDVFEYELDSPMTLYGSIPFLQAHRKDSTVGILWLNAAETWVDITKKETADNHKNIDSSHSGASTETHWFSESGLLDVFVFLGPTPNNIAKAYGELTGFTQLPQQFAIGYHQSRWNYMSEEEVKDVDRKFDRHSIPYDVIWLDLEYTDDRKYFTWDSHKFPDPISMQDHLNVKHRKLVTLIDPHIKNTGNYPVVEELKNKDHAIKNKDGTIYDGWCWPGSSNWVDCFSPAARAWWKTLFKYESWIGSAPTTFIWNDMNEPSVFNGPETTMPKDNLHYGNWEHRDVHNINGMTFVNATYHALLERKAGEVRRPFVLTRSFYAGSQRLGAMWTGDNLAHWGHLEAAFPMILSLSIAGFPFAGADVSGFFGTPSKELLTRWYQAGAFYPFFRAHSHIDTRRREPYLAGEPYTSIMTRAIRLRYQLLPAWYTAFHEASTDGSPILRPQYYVHPSDERGFAIDDQFYLGCTGILAKPVVIEGATSVDIYISDDEVYYDYFDYTIYRGKGHHNIDAPLDKVPVFLQGGHIIPRRDRPRRSSKLMKWDPLTLVVVMGSNGKAEGSIYMDDGETFDYRSGAYLHRKFVFDSSTSALTSHDLSIAGSLSASYRKDMSKVRVEKIVVVGAPAEWASLEHVQIEQEGQSAEKAEVQFHRASNGKAAWVVVRDPKVAISKDWSVAFA